jgi:L-rhamnose isomerase/sugar isomerase
MDQSTLFARLSAQQVETPSWGYARCGTRFGAIPAPGQATTLDEKLEDAAIVHRFTGICPSVALHIPWDTAPNGDWAAMQRKAASLGIRIGAINPNVFQDTAYALGSACSPFAEVRTKAIEHMAGECVAIMRATGSDTLSLWFGDGTNYPGQDCMRTRKKRMETALRAVAERLPADSRMLVEYKCFEPSFYHTDIQDWGSALLLCQKCGPQAQVLVDTGHHLPGCNIEHIVAILLDEGRLGGFHFNSRKYADDDLTVGSIDPYQMFLIYNELVAAEESGDATAAACAKRVAYMFDQSPTLKHRIEATIQSAAFVQEMYAKALLVDRAALAAARASGDVTGAEEVLRDAYHSDVRPMLATWRTAKGIAAEPLKAYRASGLKERAVAERGARHGKLAAAGGGGFQ